MKKKTMKKLLPTFILALCFLFTTLPNSSNESKEQIMPLSNMARKDNNEGV